MHHNFTSSHFRGLLSLFLGITLAVLLAMAANHAITVWIDGKYTNLTQAKFVYVLIVFLVMILMIYLFARWTCASLRMSVAQ